MGKKLTKLNVKLSIPVVEGISIEGTWNIDEKEKEAAWEMYVELVTRVPVAQLAEGEGLLRETLSSLYSLFQTTRKILREKGPNVAKPKGKSNLSFGYIAISILNYALRPLLAKWHPLLLDYENKRDNETSTLEHERQWDKNEELRGELNKLREVLIDYVDLLAEAAGVPFSTHKIDK